MNIFEAIEKRYSHKEKFKLDPVPLKSLEQIASAGLAAPTGINSQCVKLVILPDRESVLSLCEVSPTDGLRTAPAAIAVLTDPAPFKGKHDFQMEDYCAAATQMLLAITAMDYVSVWLDSPYFDEDKQKAALKVLGAPQDHHLWVVLPIGLPEGEGSRRDKLPFEQRVSYRKFGISK